MYTLAAAGLYPPSLLGPTVFLRSILINYHVYKRLCYLEAVFRSNITLSLSHRFQPSSTINKMHGFHYLPCPLCQRNVNESQPDNFYALPLDQSLVKLLTYRNWHWDAEIKVILNRTFGSSKSETCPSLNYQKRVLLFHRRCFDFVKNFSYSRIYLLVDVIELTFLDRSLPPVSKYGAMEHSLCLI